MIALRRAGRAGASVREFCEVDRWSFDPRYTEGRCPICGWQPDGAPSAPAWLTLARRVEWELLGLIVLFIVLVVLGLIVARAAGMALPLPQVHQAGTAPAGPAASPARTAPARIHETKSPVH